MAIFSPYNSIKGFAPLLGFCLLFLAVTESGNAQNGDRWKLLDVNLDSGFESDLLWPRPGSEFFWRDSNVGYYYTFDEADLSGGEHYYKTTNGGSTWNRLTNPDPIPNFLVSGQFGYAPNGYVTTNGGNSWTRQRADYSDTNDFPDQDLNYTVSRLRALNSNLRVILYQLYDYDPNLQDSIAYGPYRLGFTKDGGQNWTYVDSITVFGTTLQILDDSTSFGKFPVPEGMTVVTTNGWARILNIENDSIVTVLTKVFGIRNGNAENHYYIGRLNINSFAAQWRKLPFFEPIFPPAPVELRVEYLSNSIVIALQAEFVDINTGSDLKWTLWRSEDGGINWQSYSAPANIDFRTLRFVSTQVGIASNAKTTDGGKTWTSWFQPYGSAIDGLFYPIDSAHYKLVKRYSLFASSNDAGHTWQSNESGAVPISVAAHSGHVIVGRGYGSMIISADSGETWRDLGADGDLPDRISQILAVGYPDADFDSLRIIAIATFVEYDGAVRVAVLETSDGGANWSVGQELPELLGSVGPIQLHFVSDPDAEVGLPAGFIVSSNGLLYSENAGVTWTKQNDQFRFERINMINPTRGSAVTANGIYNTEDAGKTWTKGADRTAKQHSAIGNTSLPGDEVAFFFSDSVSSFRDWSIAKSASLGSEWGSTDGSFDHRFINAGAYWSDAKHPHVLGRYGFIYYSEDSGSSFTLGVDSVESFIGLAGAVAGGNDQEYLYVIAPGNRAGRYTMYRDIPTSVPVTGMPTFASSLLANPIRNDVVEILAELKSSTNVSFVLVDVTGRSVDLGSFSTYGGTQRFALDVAGVPSGRYELVVRSGEMVRTLPLVIVR